MRRRLAFLLMALSAGLPAAARNDTRLETRYGPVDVAEHAGTVEIHFRGEPVGAVEALNAALVHLPSQDAREFVLVDGVTSGPHCAHVYVLLEVTADGKAAASEPFGDCRELEGLTFEGDAPVVRLREPEAGGRAGEPVSFEWRNGKMVEADTAPSCAATAPALAGGAARAYRVAGPGRLPFLSAPRAGCEHKGVFVIPGDVVQGFQEVGGYTFVHYVNPKTGRQVAGWVSSGRLAGVGIP